MADENILVNIADSSLLSSLKRYFHYILEESYKIDTIENKKTDNVLCYILLPIKENEIFDEICKIRNFESKAAKESNNKVFKPIFILSYEDPFELNLHPFYNVISVKQLNKVYTISNLPEESFTRKDYQANFDIKDKCGGYIRKIIHDIKGLSIEQKKEKIIALQNQLNTECLDKIRKECGL